MTDKDKKPCCGFCGDNPKRRCPTVETTFQTVKGLVEQGGVIVTATVKMPDERLIDIQLSDNITHHQV